MGWVRASDQRFIENINKVPTQTIDKLSVKS